MTSDVIDAIAGVALILAAGFGVLAALLSQLAYAASRAGDPPEIFSTPAPLTVDFGAGEILEHGDRARARARSGALQALATACLVATSLLSLAAAKPTLATFAVGAVGLLLVIGANLFSVTRWRHVDRAIEFNSTYNAVAVRYKIGGLAAIDAAFEQQYPKLARRRPAPPESDV